MPFRIEAATLVGVNENYFSISDHNKGYTHHFSYQAVVQIIEHDGGIDIGGLFTHNEHHTIVVKVGHLMEYLPA